MCCAIAFLAFFSSWPGHVVIYHEMETLSAARTLKRFDAADHTVVHGPVQVLYPDGESSLAAVSLGAARAALPRIEADLGYRVSGKIPIVIVQNASSLDTTLGWPQSFRAEGAYDRGLVYLVAPEAQGAVKTYAKNGPVSHELTHFVLDMQTHGNYTSWYTEGLAQLEDQRITGFLWDTPQGDPRTHQPYTLSQITGQFYALPNQALAYREAYDLVHFLVQVGGPHVIPRLDHLLAAGASFSRAVKTASGLTPQQLYTKWVKSLHQ